MSKIIGRKAEVAEFKRLYDSGRPEFVAVYGRRRVGKTFLIREFFDKKFAFYHTGLSHIEISGKELRIGQLLNFTASLGRYGWEVEHPLRNWFEAFNELIKYLESIRDGQRLVVFLDELPWLDTPRSQFITALEAFWNGWGAAQDDLMLVVCGSATAWINDKLINNHGGLYGRLTQQIHLSPFTLGECEEFYRERGLCFDHYDQIQAYMVFGGIPYYMDKMIPGLSLPQNIDRLFFQKDAVLSDEFNRLFASLFVNKNVYVKVVQFLATNRNGYPQKDISQKTGITRGGGLSQILDTLKTSDFIEEYTPFGGGRREVHYKLKDSLCLFYLHFLGQNSSPDRRFWENNNTSAALNAWRGLAFENVCFSHIEQIKHALGIGGVFAEHSAWYSRNETGGAQIDLVIKRADRIINICEIKYSSDIFTISREYDAKLRSKLAIFADEENIKQALHLTFITTFGITPNEYSKHVQKSITMDDLFHD